MTTSPTGDYEIPLDIMQVHLAFVNVDLIQIYVNLIIILITQKQSVITSHERIGE